MTELSFHFNKGWQKRILAFALTMCMAFSVTGITAVAASPVVSKLVAASTPTDGTSTTDTLSVGDTFTKSKLKYEVRGAKSVALISTTSTATSITVPATVTFNGTKYNVTSIAKNAFKGKTKVKTITIGTNVKKIGASAFTGCTNLTTLKIKSTKLTDDNLAAKAFSGVKKTTTVKVPSSKVSAYTKLFQANGLATTVTVKKY